MKYVDIKPGIADHDAVRGLYKTTGKQAETKIDVYIPKADFQGPENHMLLFQKSVLASHEGLSSNLRWEEFKGALHSGIKQNVPQYTRRTKPLLPWMTQEIKRTIRKGDSLYTRG